MHCHMVSQLSAVQCSTVNLIFLYLIRVYAFISLFRASDVSSYSSTAEYYLSFHETVLSSPFLTTPAGRIKENRVSWLDIPLPQVNLILTHHLLLYLPEL